MNPNVDKEHQKAEIIAIIPARMGSSRFPGKPMALIHGVPMIEHVYRAVKDTPCLTDTIVATCDEIILDHIISIGGEAVLTSPHHERASDRCAEALVSRENSVGKTYEIVVMVQGDEPMTTHRMIMEAVDPMLCDPDVNVVNLLGKIESESELVNKNTIKVVCDLNGHALYFSRQPIPSRFELDGLNAGKQVCIIPFRRHFLLAYTDLQPTSLEIAESIDMLRVLEHGGKVHMVATDGKSHAVDTMEDLELVASLMEIQNN